ncbi:Gustatory receptor 53, partial [Operophtera brumata]
KIARRIVKKLQENYYALSPILIFENCVGIFRFYLKNGQLHPPTWAMKLYCAVLATLYPIAIGLLSRLPAAITRQENLINEIGNLPTFVIVFQITAAMITTTFFFSRSNMEIITSFAEMDDQLKTNDNDFYKKDRYRNIKYMTYMCTCQILIYILDGITEPDPYPEVAIDFPAFFIHKLEILVFCILIGMVKRRLTIINVFLSKFLEESVGNKTPVFTVCDKTEAVVEINVIGCPSENNMKIRDLAVIYDKLGTICSMINNVYNFQIFMSLVSTFIYIIITIWTSLYYYKSPENNSGPLANISIWCFTTILVVAVMCFVCERLRVVRNSTKILVNQIIMDYDLPKTMRVQAKAFMELIEAWPLRIFVYDMFSVDITLMLKFIMIRTDVIEVKMAKNKKNTIENKENAKKRNKIQENYYALSPILIFENCVGIFRFYLKNGQLHPPTWAMKSYSVFLITIYLTGFGLLLRLPAAITGQESLIEIINEVPSFVILFHYTMTMITTSFFVSSPNMEIIINLAELDDQLIKTNVIDFYNKDRNRNIKYVIFLCISQFLLSVIDIVTEDEFVPESAIIFSVYLIQKLEILVFCILIGMVKRRLTIINGFMSKFLEDNDNKTPVFTVCNRTIALKEINMIGRPSENNMKIRDLAVMYDKLGTICSMINNIYNFQIFMSLVSTFIFIIITIWTSLYYYKSPENFSGPLVSISIWCFTTILVVAVMCFVCERLRVVRNSTKILVNQIIMDYDLPKTMRVQAKAFMELIEAWPLRVLIYDMFSVDITLMLKFISVATTYLIVIIQVSHFTNY